MPIDLDEDLRPLMPRNCAPKASPLLEVPTKQGVSATEISHLLDQEKNKSFGLKEPSVDDCSSKQLRDNNKKHEQNLIVHGSEFEPYNSWKTKNAQVLHTITASSGRTQLITKNIGCSKKSNSTRRKQIDNSELYHEERADLENLSPITSNQIHKKMYGVSVNKPVQDMHSDENYVPERIPAHYGRQRLNYSHKPVHHEPLRSYEHCSWPKHCETNLHSQDREDYVIRPQSVVQNHPVPIAIGNPYSRDDKYTRVHSDIVKSQRNQQSIRNHTQPCPCSGNNKQSSPQDRDKFHISNPEFVSNNPVYLNQAGNNKFQTLNSESVTPLDIAQINNQTVMDLYNIIHLQNEQILMLQQQVKQVLQIHLNCHSSPLNQHVNHANCEYDNINKMSPDNNSHKNSPSVKNITSQTLCSPESKNNKPKRSVEAMTSSVEDDVGVCHNVQNKCNASTQTRNINSPKKRTQPQRLSNHNHPNTYHKKQASKKILPYGQEKKKKQNSSSKAKKSSKEEPSYSHSDNSFSMNEAELVISSLSQQDNAPPDASVHIDLQDDDSSDSSDSNTTTSSNSDGDDGRESESEGDSSNPQLGWTYYNQVVGHINNILKTNEEPYQRKHSHIRSRMPIEHEYNSNEEFETENNWSKRVTFDGQPSNLPRFPSSRRNKDLRLNATPDRKQDIMMYNIANENTSLSFATLRYLERHHLLPSQPEQTFKKYQKGNKRTEKKKKKSRDF